MDKITFKNALDASDFASYLIDHNLQGHRQVLIDYDGGESVSYELHDVIHSDLAEHINNKLNNYLQEGKIL